jgi:hypothetical protein
MTENLPSFASVGSAFDINQAVNPIKAAQVVDAAKYVIA